MAGQQKELDNSTFEQKISIIICLKPRRSTETRISPAEKRWFGHVECTR